MSGRHVRPKWNDAYDPVTYAATVPIRVQLHALWRFAERFRRSVSADEVEDEVRAALAAGRVRYDRGPLGLHPKSDPTCLYVWEPTGERIYALRVDAFAPDGFAVITTMRRKDV